MIPDNLPNLGWQSTEEGKASSNSQVTEKAALALSLSPPLIRTPPSHSAQLSEVNRNYHETLEDDLHLPSIRQAKKKKSKGSQPGCEAQIAATSDKTHDLPGWSKFRCASTFSFPMKSNLKIENPKFSAVVRAKFIVLPMWF